MYLRWSIVGCILFLFLGDCHMDSGDWDDSDIADTSGQRNETNLPATDTITKNSSDFHYIARDDHEVVHNLERELRRKSRKRGPTFCWRRCLRSLKCFEQMKNRPKTETGRCAVCVTKCSIFTTTSVPNNLTPNAGR